jgi:hypothetical protein
MSRNAEYLRRKNRRKSLRRVGWSVEQYEAVYATQDGCCAICGTWKRVLQADHNHTTGAPRGLLCHLCNRGLGFFRDSVAICHKAAVYLGSVR